VSRSALATAPLRADLQSYIDLLAEIASDGVGDAAELAQLSRRIRSIQMRFDQLHTDLAAVDLLIHGKGSASPWYQRQRKEAMRSRKHLRLVAANDDGPEPSGPVAAKRRAA
jgi:hypothetical protein